MPNRRVYLVDDDPSICEAFRWLLNSIGITPGIFQSSRKFLEFHGPTLTGCLVLDVRMPEMSGMAVLTRLMQKKTRLAVIMLTGHGDIPMAVQAIKLGARDFISKPFEHQSLLEKIQHILNTDANADADAEINLAAMRASYDALTVKEKKILDMITRGYMNKQIASLMEISISSVEASRAKIMYKMQAKTVAHLIRKTLIVTN